VVPQIDQCDRLFYQTHCPSVEEAETTAVMNGLRAILPNYAGPIQIESDNAFLVKELQNQACSKSAIAGTVKDIKKLVTVLS
jgi:hypothetical protein